MQTSAFRAGVLGAGQMGAGIAATLLRSEIATTMVDVNRDIVEAGSARARQLAGLETRATPLPWMTPSGTGLIHC